MLLLRLSVPHTERVSANSHRRGSLGGAVGKLKCLHNARMPVCLLAFICLFLIVPFANKIDIPVFDNLNINIDNVLSIVKTCKERSWRPLMLISKGNAEKIMKITVFIV